MTVAGEYILETHCDNSFSKVICGLDGWPVIPSRGVEIFLLIHTQQLWYLVPTLPSGQCVPEG